MKQRKFAIHNKDKSPNERKSWTKCQKLFFKPFETILIQRQRKCNGENNPKQMINKGFHEEEEREQKRPSSDWGAAPGRPFAHLLIQSLINVLNATSTPPPLPSSVSSHLFHPYLHPHLPPSSPSSYFLYLHPQPHLNPICGLDTAFMQKKVNHLENRDGKKAQPYRGEAWPSNGLCVGITRVPSPAGSSQDLLRPNLHNLTHPKDLIREWCVYAAPYLNETGTSL